jgi:hypothetical protein
VLPQHLDKQTLQGKKLCATASSPRRAKLEAFELRMVEVEWIVLAGVPMGKTECFCPGFERRLAGPDGLGDSSVAQTWPRHAIPGPERTTQSPRNFEPLPLPLDIISFKLATIFAVCFRLILGSSSSIASQIRS